jgi:hypothetical protein
MLIEFRVENHRSIRDEQALTMEASLLEDATDNRPRAVVGNDKKLLPVAALYGANASGKTNMLHALASMREAVLYSLLAWSPNAGVPRSPFRWGGKAAEPTEFVLTVLIEGTRYEYGFVADDKAIVEEWVFAWPKGKKQRWFERDSMEFDFGDHMPGHNALIRQLTRPNSLFLSAAAQGGHELLKPLYDWFDRLRLHNLPTTTSHLRPLVTDAIADLLTDDDMATSEVREAQVSLASDFRSLVKTADFGIVDVRVEFEERRVGSRTSTRPRFSLLHQHADGDGWLTLAEESKGTQTLFRMALPLLEVTASGGVLVVDELELSLHPMLAAQIVRQFNDPLTNPKNAQLIFTTHDTNLLGNVLGDPLLRRDQVWFTEKDKEGATRLYPLTDYKPRKPENLERGYLQGRYGAIPFLGNLQFAGEGE